MNDGLADADMHTVIRWIRATTPPQRYQIRRVMDALVTCDDIERQYLHDSEIATANAKWIKEVKP